MCSKGDITKSIVMEGNVTGKARKLRQDYARDEQ